MKQDFVFSVVTAVYNAAPFLPETVQSLLDQDFGFSRVQLILVDDGSTDGSAAMCDAYQKAHPDNIVVVHKANGGVSSARNEGLKHIGGRYVSFLDADDMLSKNALSCVCRFFDAHPETDVVSLPMRFFDGYNGDHLLNFKYRGGTRVIDLEAEPKNPQLAVTSAFVRAEALAGKTFDTRLKYAEDAKLLQSILLEKRTLGAVADALHHYRRRSKGEASAIQTSETSPAWYHPYLKYFCLDTIRMCKERTGGVPRFVQHTIAYDLQWRIRQERIPMALFDPAQKDEYRRLMKAVNSEIDDDVIVSQTEVDPYVLAYALTLKHGAVPDAYADACTEPLLLEFLTLENGTVTIECSVQRPVGFAHPLPTLIAEANGDAQRGVYRDRLRTLTLLDEPAAKQYGCVFRFPLPERSTALDVRFFFETDAGRTPVKAIACGQFFPVSEKYAHAYAKVGRRILTVGKDGLRLSEEGCGRFVREVRFLKELWRRNEKGGRNAVVGRLVYAVVKPFLRKPVWLISDRMRVAGDNGEALFRYLGDLRPKDVRIWFAVSERCPAFSELKACGRVVNARSFRHKLLFLLSDLNISSQADSDIITQFSRYDEPYRDIQSRIRFVFLQHGVIKDDLSAWLNRYSCNISAFVTSAKAEADSIRNGAYFYPDSVIWLTGLPRFDRLYHNEQRCITIMPTWRHSWVSYTDSATDTRELKDGFEESAFCRFFNALLNDRRLLDAAKAYGYAVRFLPHPLLQPHMHRFTHDPEIAFLPPDTNYRDVFAESDLILTDYSSVAFDFAYLGKPVVYAQFDREEFFSGENVYTQGYFDYDRDGFGEAETEYETTVDRLIEYMQNGCRLKDKYRARVDAFFAYRDQNNCRRVCEKLKELQNQ